MSQNTRVFGGSVVNQNEDSGFVRGMLRKTSQSRSGAEVISFVASFAVGKILSAKGTFVVMACAAALRTAGCKVHNRLGSGSLISARGPGFDGVTRRAVQIASPVVRVTKSNAE